MCEIMRYKLLDVLAREPLHGSDGAAGFDIYAVKKTRIGDLVIFSTGLSVEIPDGHYGLVMPRSSHVWTGLSMSSFATDADFRGEIKVVFFDTKRTERERKEVTEYLMKERGKNRVEAEEMTREYEVGDRIAQIIISPVTIPRWHESQTLSKTSRGTGGFGSTGRV